MPYCRKCGKLLHDDAAHCTVCGASVAVQNPRYSQPQQPYQPYQQPQQTPPPRKKKNGTLIALYILLGVLIAALVGVGIWFLVGQQADKQPGLGRYDVVSCVADGEELPTNGEYVLLKAKGKATLQLEESFTGTWTLEDGELTIELEEDTYTGTLEGDTLTLEIEDKLYTFRKEEAQEPEDGPAQLPKSTETTEPRAQDRTWWEGDWYGWWTVLEGSGELYALEQAGFDVCAQIRLNEDGTCSLRIWDEHRDQEQFLWEVEGTIVDGADERGLLEVQGGSFRGQALTGENISCDPSRMPYSAYPDLLCITGTYTDPEDSGNTCSYSIFLRPWGASWEDLRTGDTVGMPYADMLPIHYDEWYLPMTQRGEEMPEAFNFDP